MIWDGITKTYKEPQMSELYNIESQTTTISKTVNNNHTKTKKRSRSLDVKCLVIVNQKVIATKVIATKHIGNVIT